MKDSPRTPIEMEIPKGYRRYKLKGIDREIIAKKGGPTARQIKTKASYKELRNPMIWNYELDEEYKLNNRDVKKSERYRNLFNTRIKSIKPDYNDFLSYLPEIEIEFGEEINKLCNELINHFREGQS